jgi:hypothetical protein
MNHNSHDPLAECGASYAEETLRLVAKLPAPAGLENRVHKALRSAPRGGQVLGWPSSREPAGGWLRAAAAAAIVFVVTGGGWGVYSHVQQPMKAISMPAHLASPGSFSSAGAIRTPQTLNGPVLTHPDEVHRRDSKTPKKPVTAVSAQRAAKGTAAKPAPSPAQ